MSTIILIFIALFILSGIIYVVNENSLVSQLKKEGGFKEKYSTLIDCFTKDLRAKLNGISDINAVFSLKIDEESAINRYGDIVLYESMNIEISHTSNGIKITTVIVGIKSSNNKVFTRVYNSNDDQNNIYKSYMNNLNSFIEKNIYKKREV